MERYVRQLALPEIDLLAQEKLSQTTLLMVGAGGLGAPALPYLAGAGIGHIIIADHDGIDISNLHRQTIYKSSEEGQNKAERTGAYLRDLNPEITISTITDKITADSANELLDGHNINIILDGSDNFETKTLLNDIAIALGVPFITASVNQFQGQIGVFAGHEADKPCYRCLFPEFPDDARNCNEAGILGTSAGIVGMMQAHLTLLKLLEIGQEKPENFANINLKTMRIENLHAPKDNHCIHCKNTSRKEQKTTKEKTMTDMIGIDQLNDENSIIIDVRQPEELVADPLNNDLIKTPPMNIPLPELIGLLDELPTGQRLAFVCAGNIRSVQAAEYLSAKGYENVCVLDKFTI